MTRKPLNKAYDEALADFWTAHTRLSQIVIEDFPQDGDEPEVTRYDLDSLRDITARLNAITALHD